MKKLIFLFILMLMPMLASAATASDVKNSGCLNRTRGEASEVIPTIALTKEGSVLSVQLLNYEANCGTTGFEVDSRMSGGNDETLSLVISVVPVVPEEMDCYCPFNISFTVRGLEENKFYLTCWWYKGLVELTEGKPSVLEYKVEDATIDGNSFKLLKVMHKAMLMDWTTTEKELHIPSEVSYEGEAYTVASISKDAFWNVDHVTKVTVPKTVRSMDFYYDGAIYANPFRESKSLEWIEVEDGCPLFSSVDGVLFAEDKAMLLGYPIASPRKTYIVPEGVTNIRSGAFVHNMYLRKLVIPEEVTYLGWHLFDDTKSLEELYIKGILDPECMSTLFDGMDTKVAVYVQPSEIEKFKAVYKGPIYPMPEQIIADIADVKINETTFPDEDFRNWVLSQEYGKDGILTEEEIAGVTFMNLFPQNIIAEGHIKSLKGIEFFTAVTKLVCSRNELTELDLSKNTALTWLECDQNHLTELDLSKNTELTNLDCNSNELTALDMSCCNKLTELNCFGNNLTTLNVSGCSALTDLKCYANQLTVIDASGCTSLATMWAFDNQLSALNVLDCTSLSTLWCENSQLTQLDVSKNTKLTDLRCGENQLTQLDVSKNAELKELRCNDNQLTALDLSENKMLTSLRTYHNPIKGEAMDALIESLPTASRGGWCCVLSEDEVGVVTTTQVAAAKAKGWTSYYWNEAAKNWMEYDGSETAQDEYRPFVEDGKVWKVGALYTGNSAQLVDYFYFDGDTIIDGKTCKQMMRQGFVNPDYAESHNISQDPSSSYVGAWYEEDKKVYEYDTTNKQFKLMYDFSLEDNGTFQENDLPYVYVVGPRKTGGIKGFKGVYRDVLEWRTNGKSYKCAPWMEGVGIVYGAPILNVFNVELEDPGWYLMECYVDDEVIYLDDECEDGASPAEARKQRIDFTHTTKIKPKARSKQEESDACISSSERDVARPKVKARTNVKTRSEDNQSLYGEYNERKLDINLNPLNYAYQVCITDESGKVVYEKSINAANIVGLNIDISTYPKGDYTVTVENSNESFIGEFKAQTTGIEEVRSKKQEVSGYIYNLQGQRLSSLQKGLNIVNGQKVFVK